MPLTMQAFYNRLFSAQVTPDDHHRKLAKLATANLAEVRTIKSDLEWGPW